MDHPDKPAAFSRASAGEVHHEPEQVIAVVVTDEDDDPAGVLEKWSGDGWIYAPAEDLVELN
jgi:hypothetical protein